MSARCRYYKIADITIRVDSDLSISDKTFHPKFKRFEVDSAGKDTISIRHHFYLPNLNSQDLGKEFYRKAPWAIYKNGNHWIYLGISAVLGDKSLHRVVVFNLAHTRAKIYNYKYKETFLKGNLPRLTLFPTDQILLSRVLADREGCFLHACGVKLKGKGLLFVGRSGAGKSTMATMLKDETEILCDDRVIIRRYSNIFKIYGTWSHGDVSDVSSASAPLTAVMFLKKADENCLTPLRDKKEITKRILACLIKPFVTADWWRKTLMIVNKLVQEIPCYVLKFDKSGEVVEIFKKQLL